MSVEFGELDYTEDQALVPGGTFSEPEEQTDETGPYALELDGLDLSFLGDQEGEKANKDLLEARFARPAYQRTVVQASYGDGGREDTPTETLGCDASAP